jgi:hypothetical protein
MDSLLRPRGRTIVPVLLCLSWAGCSSRSSSLQNATTSNPANPHPASFHSGDDIVDPAGHPEVHPASGGDAISEAGIPFGDSQNLPAGTLLTVRLRTPINSASPKTDSTFVALVDEPVVIEGATVIPRGASVAGRVEDTRSSTMTHNRGYVRLTLNLVDIAGRELPIRTSSLFARGTPEPSPNAPEMVGLEQGRQLTFRLTEPVYLVSQSTTPTPQR